MWADKARLTCCASPAGYRSQPSHEATGRFDRLLTSKDTDRDPNLMPNLAALQRKVDTMKDLGFIKNRIDISKRSDLGLLKEALARLKK